MELTDIMALVKAGYTKDEIAQMEAPSPANADPSPVQQPIATPTAVTEPAPVVEPTPAPAPAPAPIQQPVQDQSQSQPNVAELMQQVAKLTSAIQANAIAQSVIPAGLQNPPQAEDMLAEIIRPTFKERSL